MSWPKKTWTPNGWKDFKTPGRGAPKGLPDDWRKHKSSVDNSTYWDVLDNPLYEAAANASGLDWEQWVADSLEAIGTEEDYGSNEYVRVQTGGGYRRRLREGQTSWVDPTYDVMTRSEAYDAGYTDEDIAAGSGEDVEGPDSDKKNWGISRGSHGSITEDLDTMHGWLQKTIKTHSLQDMPIIDRGPQGSDYGIDGDIWEHYGLDKPPKPVKEMDVNYNFNLIAAKPSNVTYATPEGYPTLDMSTESVAYEDTHYAKWQRQKGQEQRAAQHEYDHTSYGETVSSSTDGMSQKQKNRRRWQRNVKEIIGKDQDHNAWAEVAGVTDITSRNDSNLIKKAFRDHGGVLPT